MIVKYSKKLFSKTLIVIAGIGLLTLVAAGIMYVFDGLFRKDPFYVNETSLHTAYAGLIILMLVGVINIIAIMIEAVQDKDF